MSVLETLRGRLIVSVQAWNGSAIDEPAVLAAMACAATLNGAAGVRLQGGANIGAARKRVAAPIIGLIKREYAGFEPYITPTSGEVDEVVAAGADIVALDATTRGRPHGQQLSELIRLIHESGRLAMADCATIENARAAVDAGADVVATTLCGYTDDTRGTALPALHLVAHMRTLTTFVVCEGGVASPAQVTAALSIGADAVVVGTAITNIDWLVREFAAAADKRTPSRGEK